MKEHVLTSTQFTGEIIFCFDDEGFLKAFKNESELTPKQREWLLNNLPKSYIELSEIAKKSTTITITTVHLVITFDMFWKKINNPVDKAEALKIWDKMHDDERFLAYDFLPSYHKMVTANGGIGRKYPKTYLRQKPWIR